MSDRRTVLAIAVALTVLTIAVMGFVTVHATRSRILARTDASLRAQLSNAQVAVDSLTPQALTTMERLDHALSRESAILVIDAHGRVVSSLPASDGAATETPRFASAALAHRLGQPFDARSTAGDRYRVITGRIRGAVVVFATPLAGVDGTIRDVTRTTWVVGALATLLLAFLVWLILLAATRPFDSMIGVATEIGGGNFNARIESDDLSGDAKRLGAALNQMVGRLDDAFLARQESEAQLRRFVADASHELRTPLTNIQGYAQLCRMGASGDESAVAVARIEDEARRMGRLVDDLLLLARLDQGRHGPRDAVDVGDLVSDVVDDARIVEPARPSTLDVPADRLVVLGNADELRQVFANLLGNVRSHTDVTTPTTVSVAAVGDRVVVEVRDRGPGVSDADAQHVFDRFFRSDSSRSRRSGGTGLGLAIAKEIVDSHRGTIEFESRLGAGTTVRVTLPLQETRPAPVVPSLHGA